MKMISISNQVKGAFVCLASHDNLDTIKTNLEFFGVNKDEIENVLLSVEFRNNILKNVDGTVITVSDVLLKNPSVH